MTSLSPTLQGGGGQVSLKVGCPFSPSPTSFSLHPHLTKEINYSCHVYDVTSRPFIFGFILFFVFAF